MVLECDIQSTNPTFIGSEMLPRVPQRSIPIGRNIRLSSVWIPGYCMPVWQLVLLICCEEKIMIKKIEVPAKLMVWTKPWCFLYQICSLEPKKVSGRDIQPANHYNKFYSPLCQTNINTIYITNKNLLLVYLDIHEYKFIINLFIINNTQIWIY